MQRRTFLSMLPATLLTPELLRAGDELPFRIRTITAGISVSTQHWEKQFRQAENFLLNARDTFMDKGYEVQTLRITTQPLPDYLPDWASQSGIAALAEIDEFCAQRNLGLAIGPMINADHSEPRLPDWAAAVIAKTRNTNFQVNVASAAGAHPKAIRSAAETMQAISQSSAGGEGNFNFAATANCPAGTPFFPAGWHQGEPAFGIGLESPLLLLQIIGSRPAATPLAQHISAAMNTALLPVQAIGEAIADTTGRRYLGIDTSPAPGKTASIGAVIETVTGVPFGSAGTLRACATITDGIRNLDVKRCGYSGLMLPVIEDKVLARRAAEGRYTIQQLLLYSSVCGTGLDVVPLPGDITVNQMEAIIGDVAALSAKYTKPLSARLFPIPGKQTGDTVSFDHPFLTGSAVMAVD